MRDRFTIGVEEEYLLVDPCTGALISGGRAVRDADRSGKAGAEVLDALIEIGTPVCRNLADLTATLRERRFQAGTAAAAEDLEIAAAGAHPFSGSHGHALTDADRPRLLSGWFRELLRQQHICGMHVHVEVPEELDRIAILDTVRWYTPHLLALSCSSPYHLGEDTGYASFRTIAWRRFPITGPPPSFGSAAEYRAFMDLLLRAGMIPDERTVYWSIRPSARYPTLEFRVFDVCPRMADAAALAALTRAIVVAVAEGLLDSPAGRLRPSLQEMVLNQNEWITARDGLNATLIAPAIPAGSTPIRAAITELVATVAPVLEAYGDSPALQQIATILDDGNAADRMRERHAAGGSMRSLVAWIVAATRSGTGIDRRAATRGEDG